MLDLERASVDAFRRKGRRLLWLWLAFAAVAWPMMVVLKAADSLPPHMTWPATLLAPAVGGMPLCTLTLLTSFLPHRPNLVMAICFFLSVLVLILFGFAVNRLEIPN